MTTNPANEPPALAAAAFACLLGVFCDKCGTTFEGDFLVAEDWTKAQRLGCVRTHVREKLGWACDERGDFCPACRPTPNREASTDPVETLRRAATLAPELLPPSFAEMVVRDAFFYGRLIERGFEDHAGPALQRAREVLALAEQRPQPAEVTVYMARNIDEDSWLNEDRFRTFRAAYGYASGKTRAIEPLSKISAEEAYWVWRIIQGGFEFNERHKDDARYALREDGDAVRG